MTSKATARRWLPGLALLIIVAAALLVVFETVVKDPESKVVYIYSNGCGHCDRFLPKFNKVVTEFHDINVERWDVSSDQEGYRIAMELGAKVTPTVFLIREGVVVDKLEGDVSEQETRAFLQRVISLKR